LKGLEFKYVVTNDWYGVFDKYKIKKLKKRDSHTYKVIFRNSRKDLDIKVVSDQDLYQ